MSEADAQAAQADTKQTQSAVAAHDGASVAAAARYDSTQCHRAHTVVLPRVQWGKHACNSWAELLVHSSMAYGNCYNLGSNYLRPRDYHSSSTSAARAFCGTSSSSSHAFKVEELEVW